MQGTLTRVSSWIHWSDARLQEVERGEDDTIETSMEEARLVVHEPRVKVDLTKYVERHVFTFDDVLDDAVSNDAVYRSTVKPLVATIFRSGKVWPAPLFAMHAARESVLMMLRDGQQPGVRGCE